MAVKGLFSLQNRGELPGAVEQEIENLVARIREFLLTEHNADGTHNVALSTSSGGSGDIITTGLSVLGRPDNVTADAESITASADGQVLRRAGTILGFGTLATASLSNNSVTLAKLADIATLSVIGRSTAGTGDPQVITAGTDNQVLRRSGTTLAFGAVNIASSDAITGSLPYANMPSGSGTWTAVPTISGAVTMSSTLNVTGVATLGGNAYPTVTGTNDQVLTTNGSGTLSWTDKAGGGGGGITSLNSQTGATQTFTNDTNVVINSAANAHVLGWSGQLSLTRGGTAASLTAAHGAVVYSTASALALTAVGTSGQILKSVGAGTPAWNSPAALTKVDDTNVTLTLGGSPSTSLVNAASLTLGWTGQLSVSRGGTGLSSVTTGKVLYGNGTSALNSSNLKFVPPGTNTLSTAVAAMSNGDVIWLDAGTYTQTESVAIPAGVQNFSIIGQGANVTDIIYTTTDVDGITCSSIGSSDSYRITACLLADFSMRYNVGSTASTKTAIVLWGDDYDSYERPAIRIRNVSIAFTSGGANNCWLTGIRLINSKLFSIDNVLIRREANGRTGTGILLESCMNGRIQNTSITCVSTGISLVKASDSLIRNASIKHGCEDITISASNVYIAATAINLGYKAFVNKLINLDLSVLTAYAIYEDISSGAENGGYQFIDNCYLEGAGTHTVFLQRNGTKIRGCHIGSNTVSGNAVTVSSAHNIITDNFFSGVGGSSGAGGQGIWILGDANFASGNMFESSSGFGSDIYISGNNNVALHNMLDATLTDVGVGNTTTPNYTH